MEINTVKGIFRLTDLQEETFELIEDWLWSVIERGAPAPEEIRTMIGRILEGGMPSEEMVAIASRALEASYLASLEDDDQGGMTSEEIPTTDEDPHWMRWCQGMDQDIRDGQEKFWAEKSAQGLVRRSSKD